MHLFLHGFLGNPSDWDRLFSHFPKSWNPIAPPLPGHAGAPTATDIPLAIHRQFPKADWLIGYSAGGRVALELKARFKEHYGQVIAISTHPGIVDPLERKERLEWDFLLAKKLLDEPLEPFLKKWYEAPLFSSFRKHPSFPKIFEKRMRQKKEALAHFLTHFSTGMKPPPEISPDTIFIFGEEDLKYERLYRRLVQIHEKIAVKNASHAVHLENPKELAFVIKGLFDEHN